MATTKTNTKKPNPKTVVSIDGDTAHVAPINPADTAEIARLLLDAADNPSQVRTTTAPIGWQVPTTVAKKL